MVENGLEDKLGNDESVEKIESSRESDNSQKHFNNYVLCPLLDVFFRGKIFNLAFR